MFTPLPIRDDLRYTYQEIMRLIRDGAITWDEPREVEMPGGEIWYAIRRGT